MSPEQPAVLLEQLDDVLVMTMSRPERRNALDSRMGAALTSAFARLEDDDGLRVGVLAGAGTGFCAGLDLHEFARVGTNATDEVRALLECGSTKPVM